MKLKTLVAVLLLSGGVTSTFAQVIVMPIVVFRMKR